MVSRSQCQGQILTWIQCLQSTPRLAAVVPYHQSGHGPFTEEGQRLQICCINIGDATFSLQLCSNVYNLDQLKLLKSKVENAYSGVYEIDDVSSSSVSLSTIFTSICTTGGRDQGTSAMTWDTADVPSGLHFHMADKGIDSGKVWS